MGEIRARIEQQIELNTLASEEGLTTNYGLNVGKTILKYSNPNDVWIKAKAHAAAGSDARMGGSVLPVMTICGSGNQGITACVPLVVYAQAHNIEHEQLIKAVALSNLVAIHIKHHMGRLSAFCGVMTAGMGVSAGLTFLSNGTLQEIEETVQNIIGDISGVFCDGAKPTCATKIASSIDAAFQAHYLVKDNNMINSDMGIISAHNVEQTIRNIGKIGGEAMNNTDQAICDIMAKRI
ncbi:hypothetical protein AwWohl_14570 [Gammaproteobacteria bacterium]|nr:hypothetical protein AwWohl_14570 [Gammaproteobacteria bacterium]